MVNGKASSSTSLPARYSLKNKRLRRLAFLRLCSVDKPVDFLLSTSSSSEAKPSGSDWSVWRSWMDESPLPRCAKASGDAGGRSDDGDVRVESFNVELIRAFGGE